MDSETLKNEGNAKYKDKDYLGAAAAYTKAIEIDPENASLYTNRAAAYLMVLQYKDASDDCTKAISIDSTNSKAYFRKATALKGQGLLDEAIASVDMGLQYDPQNTTAMQEKNSLNLSKQQITRVQTFIQQKQFRQALVQIDSLISSLGSNIYRLNMFKISILLELQRPEDALNLSNLVMKVAKNGDIELLHLRAKALYLLSDLPNAIKHLQQAMRSDPDNTELRIFLRKIREVEEQKEIGNNAFKQSKYQEAIDAWTSCINKDPANKTYNAKLYCNRANAHLKLKRPEEAVRDCDRSLNANADYVKAYLRRAEANFAIGGVEELKRCVRLIKAASLYPKKACFKHLVIQPKPLMLDGWWQDMPCSFLGPSSLYQRWNIQLRHNYEILTASRDSSSAFVSPHMPTDSVLQVLLVVRQGASGDGSIRSSRFYLNTDEIIATLTSIENIKLIAMDIGTLSFESQLRLIGNSSVVIGMHGAGITHSMHMSIGTRYCCGVIEIFPQGEYMPIRGHGNMARRMGHHYSRLDLTDSKHTTSGTEVPVDKLKQLAVDIIDKVRTKPTCVLSSVLDDPFM
eukprot:gene10720-22385_t